MGVLIVTAFAHPSVFRASDKEWLLEFNFEHRYSALKRRLIF